MQLCEPRMAMKALYSIKVVRKLCTGKQEGRGFDSRSGPRIIQLT
jgi:hypothetical protein